MKSLTIGQFRGIDLNIHPTFGLVLLWVLYHFGVSRRGGVPEIVYGLVLMGLIFGCVLLHELGHSLMAQEYGIRVRNITLFPFGGAAFIEQMPVKPKSEMLITVAGPAVNIAISIALLPPLLLIGTLRGFDSFSDYLGYFDDVAPAGVLIYLFFANIMMFVFNLLPAFPMDGGRLVRAGLSTLIGRERATNFAVILGTTAALAMAVVGIWFGEYVLALIALFVIVAAYGEGKSVRLESAMKRLRVGQFALWDSGGISEGHPLTSALRGGPRDLVVTNGGRVVGMLWRRDVMRVLNGGAGNRTVADVMDRNIITAHIDDSVYDVQQQMQRTNRWAVPVTEDDHYRGIFTADRVVHVYRYLNAHSTERRFISFAAVIGNLLKGDAR